MIDVDKLFNGKRVEVKYAPKKFKVIKTIYIDDGYLVSDSDYPLFAKKGEVFYKQETTDEFTDVIDICVEDCPYIFVNKTGLKVLWFEEDEKKYFLEEVKE